MIGIFVLLIIAMLLVVKFCKKTLKRILVILLVLITLYCVVLSIDMNRTYTMEKPIFAISSELKDYKDYSQEVYKGLGYRVEMNLVKNHKIISSTMYLFNKVIAGAIE